MNTNNVFEIRSLLQNAQSVLIALAETNDEDVIAAGLGLYLTLVKTRKQVTIVSPQDIKVELSHLYGIDKITKQIAGGNNLVVSMPYKEGSIEKVSYHIENNRFNLVIEPRGERLDFDPNQIEYNYGRGDYDAVIVLGANNVSALGEIYLRHKNVFTQKPLVNIDKSPNNTKFGRINIVEEIPVSQTVAQLIKDMRLPIDQDAASNLYTGVMKTYGSATIDALDPRTIDVLAFLAKLNAQNLRKGKSAQSAQSVQNSGTIQVKEQTNQVEQSNQFEQSNGIQQKETPEDWLKPKIFTTNKQGE